MAEISPDSTRTRDLLAEVRDGHQQALDRLLGLYRRRLHAFIASRLDPRLRARLDPSDVVQETQLRIAARIRAYLKEPPMPFHLWARKLAYDRLLSARRDHRHAARRSVDRETRWPERSSVLLARPLLAGGPSPSEHLAAREFAERVGQAVARLSEADREILLMRHAESLSYEEVARLLDIEPAAARKRYGRALLRLRQVLSEGRLC
jgi:RNA polymerase sigma-70 factor (ECF subfamily)